MRQWALRRAAVIGSLDAVQAALALPNVDIDHGARIKLFEASKSPILGFEPFFEI